MKKSISILLMLLCVGSLLCMSVAAAGADTPGVYAVVVKNGYTLTPKNADGANAAATSATIDGKTETFYPGAEKFTLTYTYADASAYHLVLALSGESQIPTAENICYIDQSSAENGAVTFTIYPKTMAKGSYHIYLAQTGGTGLIDVASFSYFQPYTLGDVNDDGIIDVRDVQGVLDHIAQKQLLTEGSRLAADVATDDVIDVKDVQKILDYIVQRISDFN